MIIGKIGLFFLLYIIVGWILDIISTIVLIFISAVKDEKDKENKMVRCKDLGGNDFVEEKRVDYLTETFSEMGDDLKNKDRDMIRAAIFGRLFWPIFLPKGISDFWDQIK